MLQRAAALSPIAIKDSRIWPTPHPKLPCLQRSASGKAAKPVVATTLKQIAAQVTDSQGLSKNHAEAVLNETIERISKSITKGHRVLVGALCIFTVKKLGALKGRNPATGEAIKIKASKKVAFRAAKELKEAL